MKVLVTGGTGLVGSHAVTALVSAGHELRLLARSAAKAERVPASAGESGHDIAIGDMRDAAAVKRALTGCDAVLHAAALVEIGRSKNVYDANVSGTCNVLGTAAELGLDPIVYISSVSAMFPPRGATVTVDDPVGHLETGYARSKARSELYARQLQQRGIPVVTLYPAAVYGPHDPSVGLGVIGLRERIRFGWPMTSGGMSNVDARDLAAVVAAAMKPQLGARRFMAAGHFLTWAEEAAMCERILGKTVGRVRISAGALRAAGRLVEVLQRLIPRFEYPLTHEASLLITQSRPCDSRATITELGVEFRSAEQTYEDTLRWMVAEGHLAAYYAPRLVSTRNASAARALRQQPAPRAMAKTVATKRASTKKKAPLRKRAAASTEKQSKALNKSVGKKKAAVKKKRR